MNKKAANIQTLARIGEMEAQLKALNESQGLTIDDIRNTIHQIADIVVELSEAVPAILAELKALAELIAKMTDPGPEFPPRPPIETPAAARKAAKKP